MKKVKVVLTVAAPVLGLIWALTGQPEIHPVGWKILIATTLCAAVALIPVTPQPQIVRPVRRHHGPVPFHVSLARLHRRIDAIWDESNHSPHPWR